jgi:hypothetical protein
VPTAVTCQGRREADARHAILSRALRSLVIAKASGFGYLGADVVLRGGSSKVLHRSEADRCFDVGEDHTLGGRASSHHTASRKGAPAEGLFLRSLCHERVESLLYELVRFPPGRLGRDTSLPIGPSSWVTFGRSPSLPLTFQTKGQGCPPMAGTSTTLAQAVRRGGPSTDGRCEPASSARRSSVASAGRAHRRWLPAGAWRSRPPRRSTLTSASAG